MNNIESAAFSLIDYKFTKASFNFCELTDELSIRFEPSGVYDESNGEFSLKFDFFAAPTQGEEATITVRCEAIYKFKSPRSFSDIPEYFYANIIAILFPYVRSFVSTLTLQSNTNPLVLPTLNLSAISKELKESTSLK